MRFEVLGPVRVVDGARTVGPISEPTRALRLSEQADVPIAADVRAILERP